MKIFPAIDIKDKKCVRLIKGDFENKTEYATSPIEQAAKYKEYGFKNLHIIDLDGALTGKAINSDIIEEIVKKYDLEIEVGGGIRTLDTIKKYIETGVEKVILGSAAIKNKEFDFHRKEKTPHPVMIKNKLNLIPFDHPEINKWREPLTSGVSYLDKETNLIIKGGIDDVWFDQDKKELIVVDYKAQSTNYPVEPKSYLESKFHQGYKRQMDIYVHILKNMNFKVSNLTYFLVCNAEKAFEKFNEKLNFKITLIPYEADVSWIPNMIKKMKKTLDSEEIPEFNENCERCTYLYCGSEFNISN